MGHPAQCSEEVLDYHVVACCRDGAPLLDRPEERRAVASALLAFKRQHAFRLYGYVVMPNHIHVLLGPPRAVPVEKLAADLLDSLSRAHGSGKTLWAVPHRITAIEPGDAALRCLRYIDRNPVRRRLVRRPAEYRWGSFRSYAANEASAAVDLHPSYLALGPDPQRRQRRYAAQVNGPYDEGLDHRQPEFSEQPAYGSPEFLAAVIASARPRVRSRRVSGAGEVPPSPRAAAGRGD